MRNAAAVGSLVVWALVVFTVAEVKDARFSCRGRSPGYYADLGTNCQDYHMCDAGGRRYTYSCPNQTRFQQRVMICDHWFMVDCSLSESHFDANLLIGQKDKQFVEPFPQEDGDRKPFNRVPSPTFRNNHSQPQAANEIKKSFLPSPTKKILEERNTSVKFTETKFSTPTYSIKPTTERDLPREFANNPFFSSLTQAPSAVASKGDRGSLTFQQRIDQAQSPTGLSQSQKPRATSTPPLSTSQFRQTSPPLRNAPTFANYEQWRTSTFPTTTPPPSRDYGFVTRGGNLNRLPQTEPPRLFRNDLSKVIEITSFGAFTTQSPLTSQYESVKTRVDVRAPLPVSRAPPTPSAVPTTRAPTPSSPRPTTRAPSPPTPHPTNRVPPSPSRLPTTRAPPSPSPQPNRTQASSLEGVIRPPNATQWPTGLQRTPGGFRYVTKEAAQVPDRRPTAFVVQVPSGADFSTGSGSTKGPKATKGGLSTGSGGATGKDFPTGSDISTGKGFPTSPDYSTGKWYPTAPGLSTGKGFQTRGDVSTGGLTTGVDVSFSSAFPSGSDVSTGSDLPTGPDVSLEDRFSSGLGVSFEQFGSSGPGEEEEDFNTVEVRIPDPRRMFFIPDSAAREAEMLNSTNETVLRIPLPSSRHHGPMRFKGVRGAKGRHPDCPQCHPAFLVPGSCEPCVLIRR